MNRYRTRKQIELVNHAIEILPTGIKNIVKGVNFVFDYNPIYLGLCPLIEFDRLQGIRTTENTCFYIRAKKTIILFSNNLGKYKESLDVIWHEIGHHIDSCLDYDRPLLKALNKYEAINIYETFAGAFVRWLYNSRKYDTWGYNRESLLIHNPEAISFFNKINEIKG